MDAVAVVCYVKSKVFRVGLDARIYESASGNTVKMEILKDNALQRKRRAVESFLDEKLIKRATACQCFSNRFWRTPTTRPVFRFTIFFKLIFRRRFW